MIDRLRRELAALRMQYANLLAAARATLSAARDGDPYALEFLADELATVHGQHDLDHHAPPIDRGCPGAQAHWREANQ